MAISIGCFCDDGNGNTALPKCISNLGITIGNGIQEMVAKDGTRNGYDLSAPLGTTFVDSLQATDTSKRMYPLRDYKNMDFPKGDTQYATNSDGSKTFLREGIQSFVAEMHDVPAGFDSKLQNMKCKDNGAWGFVVEGVYGMREGDMWYPININTFAPTFKMRTPAAPQMEMIAYDWAGTANAGRLYLVPWADLGTTYEAMLGLMDINYNVTNAPVAGATTTVSYEIVTDYGEGLLDKQTVDGLVTANFAAFNQTTGLAVAITSATEVPDVDYDFVLPSQTTADQIRISVLTSTGYEGIVTFVEP